MSYTKKYIYKKQYSIDEGQTWEDVVPLELTTSGDSIGYFDTLEECQTTPYGLKFYATFSNKSPLSVECNGNPELNSNDAGFAEENITSAIIGDCVIKIQGSLFGNTNLSSVTISDSVMYIGYAAFAGCKNLKRVNSSVDGVCNIPSGVTSIDYSAFENCSGLTSANISNGAIGRSAFQSCSSLSSVTIGSGVTSIGDRAFDSCTSLTSIDIPNSVTSIGSYAFLDCTSLTSVTIGSGVTSISQGAFNSCSSLTSIDIPNSVTSIGHMAFRNCSGLTSITLEATTPPTLGSVVFENTNNCPILVPSASLEAYKTASGWSTYADRIYPSA